MTRVKMVDSPEAIALLVRFGETANTFNEVRSLQASPLREALRKAGLIESYRSRNWHATSRWWRLTDAGRARYLEIKGITRG